MEYKPNKVVAVVVVLVCIVSMLVIYKLTIGSKVSMPAEEASGGVAPAGGAGASHAVEVGDEEPVTKPAEEKQPLPPGTKGKAGH